jgi:hypothetical protein
VSELLQSVPTLSEAWLLSLERVAKNPDAKAVHVVSTVTEPGTEIAAVRAVLDDALDKAETQSVQTVAETIFPVSLYADPGIAWSPGLDEVQEAMLDGAAETLYGTYCEILPLLLTADGNRRGTYFSRMISWPGRTPGGVNQLAARVEGLRREHRASRRTHNALDIELASDAGAVDNDTQGVQIYAATDRRTRGFPCLTHVDLTLYNGRLHATAVYRHQYLIDKAYGNLLGLSWMMDFLCQQSGFQVGELVVHATFADAQRRAKALALASDARAAIVGASVTPIGATA